MAHYTTGGKVYVITQAFHRLKDIAVVTDEKNGWVRGHFALDPSVVFELCFELMDHPHYCLQGTCMSYVGMWSGKRCLFEFSLGITCHMPSRDHAAMFVMPLIEALAGYRPMKIIRDK